MTDYEFSFSGSRLDRGRSRQTKDLETKKIIREKLIITFEF